MEGRMGTLLSLKINMASTYHILTSGCLLLSLSLLTTTHNYSPSYSHNHPGSYSRCFKRILKIMRLTDYSARLSRSFSFCTWTIYICLIHLVVINEHFSRMMLYNEHLTEESVFSRSTKFRKDLRSGRYHEPKSGRLTWSDPIRRVKIMLTLLNDEINHLRDFSFHNFKI